ncbi:uncharacterized protein LOC129220295 [Uloborus diversus]|uniref:uncharacterized protein LOC129220295 n=1 Tax=Uloborus diversus TaxID=327109 RepID=UPI00240987F5|nr:uncharacterized protein LOC129220295 [Uloborus diversus]
MPGVGRYHCKSCRYVANNRRMLARHVALIHCEKVFKCPVCPFVTRYAANWYRHKRSLHGINKDTTCEACGFFANSIPELAQHKEEAHPELPQVEKNARKHAEERPKLNSEFSKADVDLVKKDVVNCNATKEDGYRVENGQNLDEKSSPSESVSSSLPVNGFYDSGVAGSFSGNAGKTVRAAVTMNDTSASGNLRPLRVKRSYSCDRCGLLTNNPREFLYHLKSIHGEKLSIHECKYCVYASKHVQKLQRHCNLVHRQQLAKDPEYQKQLEAAKEKRSKPEMIALPLSTASEKYLHLPKVTNKPALKIRPNPAVLKCSACPYQTRNKNLLLHHEKTAHFKKRFYRCLQCGYVTNEKGRYTKHIKYHSLPKMQCEYCFFKTAYKWNMDRHMKNHEDNADGEFRCNLCNFTTSTKQSFKAHVTNHHDPSADDVADQEIEMDGPNESSDWEDLDFDEAETSNMQMDDNASYDCYDFPDARETPDMVWKDGKAYQKTLKCKSCDFKAAWPFEMKKHEETHKGQKKHHCPLCGMRFEHIAWLTKHLRRVHRESSQAKNIAAAFDLLKPNRRRPGKEYATDAVLPMFQDVLKQNTKSSPEPSKPSMLSSLLKKPLHTFSSTVNRYSSLKSKVYNSSQNALRQTKLPSYYEKPGAEESYEATGFKSKSVPTCNVCGYKTRWISELQRHMRVHSQEKPFQCPKCKYHCKWKGDLNRHLMKYHGIKVPTPGKKQNIPKIKFKTSSNSPSPVNDWQSNSQEKRSEFSTSTPLRKDQESPLDLTLGKETFPHPHHNESVYDAYDFDSQSALDSDVVDVVSVDDSNPASRYSPFKSPLAHLRESSNLSDDSSNAGGRRKYRCPFCTFETTTASRFHVHIVQHYNRRPFMCSVCGYNSNWEWDITKHIRLKGCRDKSHNKACVLLTDESGKRNYEKYDKYLTDIDQDKPCEPPPVRLPEVNDISENIKYNTGPPTFNNAINKSCSYDFRNIGSNFEEPQDMPENIVVTPDIDLSEPLDMLENQSDMLQINLTEGSFQENSNEAKQFYCKHCNFKHSTKRVVVSHLSIHAGIKPFRCRACGISSNWRHVIVRHVKDAHNGYMNEVEDRINFVQEGYSLRLTSINAGDSAAIQPGREMPHSEQFGCKICPYKCDKEFYMKFHMKQHRPREGAVFKCEFCPYFVKFKKTLVRHLKLHNVPSMDDGPPNTEVSYMNDSSFSSQPILYQNDMYDFYENGQNDSAEDDSIVISFDKLNQSDQVEQTSPPKIKRHVCEHCPYKTDNKTQYLYHKQFHRPNPSAPFKCSICTYWATMQHLLTQHMKVHSDADASAESEPSHKPESVKEPSPPSEEEPLDSPEKDDLDEKICVVYVKRGDLIVKMFKCQFCPMMNKKKANVRVHQKMHGVIVNDGKFACTYCNYQCLNQGGLTNHIKVHQKVPEKQVEQSELEADNVKNVPEPAPLVEENRKGYTYFCMKCPAVFKSAADLQIHSKFHGATLPFPCPDCDYHARHRPHLSKHMTVHGAEYKAKRAAAESQNSDHAKTQVNDSIVYRNVNVKKVDQMLLLEASEMRKAFRQKDAITHNLHKCVLCPSVFFKTTTLAYHISLHGSDGEFKCSQCDYAVSRSSNLTCHSQVHPKKAPVKRPLKTFPCTKCPAVFYKQDRYDRHQLLHGQNYKFRCEHCDYSVRFAANLIKHRNLHTAKKDAENAEVSVTPTYTSASQNAQPLIDNANFQNTGEKKTVFICDRCPYFQTRKDAVQSHQRRHWLEDGFKCPYCDYSSMQSSFLQNHIKIHIQPSQIFPPHAFIKFESFKIYCRDEGNETLLFDDEDMKSEECDEPDEESETEIPKKQKLVKFSHSSKSENSLDSHSTDFSKKKKISVLSSKYDDNSLDSNSSESSKRKRSSNICSKSDDNSLDSVSSEFLKRKKFSNDILKCDENSYDSISSNNSKVPVVVLSDIFGNKKGLKKLNQLKFPKYNSNKSVESPKSSTKDSTGSLVLKIKLKSCLVNKHEKTMYSVTSSCERKPPKVTESCPASAENTNDSYPDVLFGDSKRTDSTSPVDIEENTLTSTSGVSDTLRAADEVDDMIDSIAGPETDDLLLSNPLNDVSDVKSDDSFSNDTVPVVIGEICEKLGSLGDISFKDELSLSTGTCSNSLTNGLLPEEIKI